MGMGLKNQVIVHSSCICVGSARHVTITKITYFTLSQQHINNCNNSVLHGIVAWHYYRKLAKSELNN